MKVYRQIKSEIWQDSFILDLPAPSKIGFLYLLTNSKSSLCGIFELSTRQMQNETGLELEVILEQIQFFSGQGKIVYDSKTHEFLIVNWMKHNIPMNPSVAKCVRKEVEGVKSSQLRKVWNDLQGEGDTVSTQWAHSVDTVPTLCSGVREEKINFDDNYNNVREQQEHKEQQRTEQEQEVNVLGYSSVDICKEVGCSLPGLKEEEPKESKQKEQHLNKPKEVSALFSLELNLEEKNMEPTPEPKSDPPPEEVIIHYFNQHLCTGYRLDSGSVRTLIQKKLAEKFTIADFKIVIDKKKADWEGTKFASNLVPHLLFGDRFETYLQQIPRSENRKGYQERIPVSTFHNHTSEIVEVF